MGDSPQGGTQSSGALFVKPSLGLVLSSDGRTYNRVIKTSPFLRWWGTTVAVMVVEKSVGEGEGTG